ncbi:hypothetical protein H70357_02890 [Paenibacillus sp. FSL H7-0357]|uniref:phosphotransferase family protein n=1 Tax=Paenibacillus sp. FSL H7-0357 TaxID=1536774 RepID=UPI0004F92408|nr:aminoglycoside phosphotransferase family protein [Paenibacillus sp. FSL H7-0357]AIQ15759.1 hypothetical protein H70357_02890 [Paenibacillus sp. FSL H7-0357]
MQGKLVGKGRTAEVWEHGEGRIIKLYNGDIPEPYVEREYLVSKYVFEQGLCTPEPLELVGIDGRKGIVFQQIQGRSLLRMISGQPWQLGKYAKQMARLHNNLHQLEGTEDFGRQKAELRKSIIAAPMLSMEEKSAVLDHLEGLPEGNKLCHGDFHPDNVLLNEQAWIIDWMTGIMGNPAGDAARSVLLFSMGAMPPGASKLAEFVIGFMRQRLTKGYIREYLALSGQSYAAIDSWILPVAAARLVEGVPVEEKEQLVREIRKRLSKSSAI